MNDNPAGPPEWVRTATLYQVNTRQFTAEGTFRAATAQLPRLARLGVDILWLMPVHPIGEVKRKGRLGSPYAVRDHYEVNPELGDLEELRALVHRAHALGMHVILDWVAHHTAWDHPLTEEHPEWYERDRKGDFRTTPWQGWDDVIDLDYRQPGLRKYMMDAMRYWVEEVGVDGFRADVASFVPLDFWEDARRVLERVKPVFMLAEGESRDLLVRAFDATYGWRWNDAVHRVARGLAHVDALRACYGWWERAWPRNALAMTFVSNHDHNAWEGTQFERMGPALEVAIVLSVVGGGIPLLYNGQEAGNERRLAFFEKDPIRWRPHPIGDLYRDLFALKHENRALWNGPWGAPLRPVPNDHGTRVLSFVRCHEGNAVFAALNFSGEPVRLSFQGGLHHGEWTDPVAGGEEIFDAFSTLELEPWDYRVFVR